MTRTECDGKTQMNSQKKDQLIAAIQAYLDSLPYQEFHCSTCGKWLSDEKIMIGMSEIKCRKCKTLNIISRIDLDTFFQIIENSS